MRGRMTFAAVLGSALRSCLQTDTASVVEPVRARDPECSAGRHYNKANRPRDSVEERDPPTLSSPADQATVVAEGGFSKGDSAHDLVNGAGGKREAGMCAAEAGRGHEREAAPAGAALAVASSGSREVAADSKSMSTAVVNMDDTTVTSSTAAVPATGAAQGTGEGPSASGAPETGTVLSASGKPVIFGVAHTATTARAGRVASVTHDSGLDVFDALKMAASSDEPLTKLVMHALTDVIDTLGLDADKLYRFLRVVESSMPANHYHNATHVLDVTQLMYLQASPGGPIADVCQDPHVKLAAMLAAASHDFAHPGVTSAFLNNTDHDLVSKYGKENTLERMHIAQLQQLCADPDYCFFPSEEGKARTLRYAQQVILATDMSKHMSYVEMQAPTDAEELIIFKLQMAMKCSDLSHCMRKFSVHYLFVENLKAEFYQQGDQERKKQLPVSAGMDRGEDYRAMALSQAYFLNSFIDPLLVAWCRHTGDNALVTKMRKVLQRNITSWKLLSAEPDTREYSNMAATGSIPVRKITKDMTIDMTSRSMTDILLESKVQEMYGLV